MFYREPREQREETKLIENSEEAFGMKSDSKVSQTENKYFKEKPDFHIKHLKFTSTVWKLLQNEEVWSMEAVPRNVSGY